MRAEASESVIMWRSLSLRARINCLVGIVLTLGLAANVARLVLEAGPRVQAEDRSVIRLTHEVIESVGPSLSDAPDSQARLDKVVGDLNRLRHVSIVTDREATAARESQKPDNDVDAPPAWFVALIHPERISVSVPVLVGGKQQTLSITSHPDDEMQEIWDGIVTQLVLGIIIAVVLFFVTSTIVRRALAPLDALSQAMIDIEAGRYQARVAPSGAPELAALCERLNHLAGTLAGALEDRRRLSERMVSLQDIERKDIARELHDEFGPHLFALRAHAGAVCDKPSEIRPARALYRSMAPRSSNRSMFCSNITAGYWSGCVRPGSPISACRKRSRSCCGCGAIHILQSRSKAISLRRSQEGAKLLN